ncbi:MAG: hypothetical protein ABH851_00795 [Methanobacteriota archaeon]
MISGILGWKGRVERIALFFVFIVLFSGCVDRGVDSALVESTSTVKSVPSSTTVSQATTSIGISSTSMGSSTSTVLEATSTTLKDECASISNSLNQSLCYFNEAIRLDDASLCELISHEMSREMCAERFEVEEDPTSRVFGFVKRKTPAEPLSRLLVEIESLTLDRRFSTMTARDGGYSVKVFGGDKYSVTVHYQNNNFTQHIFARKNMEHQIDYIISN